MERDSSRGRTQLAATLIAHGEQRPSGREVDTEFLGRRGPWDVSMVVVGTATRVSCGHQGMQDLVVASFLMFRSSRACLPVFTQRKLIIFIVLLFLLSN